jgi:methyl-accepting chemotaxis protein
VRRLGLRARFNLVVVSLVAAALSFLVVLDYRHEFRSVMDAHGIHAGRIDAATEPVLDRTTPDAVARRTIALHAVVGTFTLLALIVAVNITLTRFVLAPIARVRAGIERLQRGFRPGEPAAASLDEVGDVVSAFDDLGLTLDAVMRHVLHTERLATQALLSTRLSAEVEPEVQRIGIAATRLHEAGNEAVREAAHEIAAGAAQILAAVRCLDRPFAQIAHKPAAEQGR